MAHAFSINAKHAQTPIDRVVFMATSFYLAGIVASAAVMASSNSLRCSSQEENRF